MADEPQTTGTPTADGGDAQTSATTGTPREDGRDAAGDIAKLNMEWKAKAERLNALEAELADLKARQQSPAAGTTPPGDDGDPRWKQVVAFAAQGDPVAQALIEQREREQQLIREIGFANYVRDQLDDIPKDERKPVLEYWNQNRNRFGDPLAAKADLDRQKLERENAELRAKYEAATKRPEVNNVPTHTREVSASEARQRQQMTARQFDKLVETTRREQGDDAARMLGRRLRNDEIELID